MATGIKTVSQFISGWWYTYPSEKYESQMGYCSQYDGKVIKFHGSKPPTRYSSFQRENQRTGSLPLLGQSQVIGDPLGSYASCSFFATKYWSCHIPSFLCSNQLPS